MLMVSAILASIRGPVCLAMMLGDLLASRAMNAVRVQLANERIETGCIVWILALKLHQRVQAFAGAGADWIVSINFAHVFDDRINVVLPSRGYLPIYTICCGIQTPQLPSVVLFRQK
jgi:hypothetical protein